MGKTIILMDYSEFEREKARYVIDSIGDFDVTELASESEFQSMKGNLGTVSLFIMDISFPTEKPGFEMLSEIKSNPAFSQVPVIICTRANRIDIQEDALRFGVDDFILKPYKPQRLESSIRSFITVEKKFRYNISGAVNITLTFEDYFDKELKLSERLKQPLSVIVITQLETGPVRNEETSHRIYALTIDRVKKSLRTTDYAVINNNKDILVVLPYTDKMGAYVVNEKITRSVSEVLSEIGIRYEDSFFGSVATYPEDGMDFQSLMESAFKRISAKQSLERFTGMLGGSVEHAASRYKQFKKLK